MKKYYVSHYPSRPQTPWKLTVPAALAGKRVRRFFATEAEAWAEGPKLLETIQKEGLESLGNKIEGMTVASAAKEYLLTKAMTSDEHRAKIKRVTEALATRFPGPVRAIAPLMAQKWFSSIKGSPTTRAGWHRYASGFFSWCVDMEISERNPLRRVAAPRAESRSGVLTAEQISTILNEKMSDPLRAWFLLGAFAGLRSIEVRRMSWDDIDAKVGEIFIRKETSKQSSGLPERIVDFTKPLKKRKEFFAKKTGAIVCVNSLRLYRERMALVARLHEEKKVPWPLLPENALRHSFATYHLAACQDAQKTAHQLGHSSAKMVREVYAIPARRADSAAWWAV